MPPDPVPRSRPDRPAPGRRRALAGGLLAAGFPVRAAHALMAGALPDTPAARVDANLTSSPWAGVVCVRVGDGAYSGALVHRRLVLTAAHVAAGQAPTSVSVQLNAGESRRLGVARVHAHPGWKGFTKPFAYDDVALLELESDVPEGVPVYTPYYGPLRQGTELTFVGYGASGHGDRGPSVDADPAVKRTGRNRIDRVVPRPEAPTVPALFLYDFDGPDASSDAFGGTGTGNAAETSAAGGDSGAPAFVQRGEFPRIAAVLTFVGDFNRIGTPLSAFGSSGGGVLLSAVRPWLGELIAAV